MESGKQLMESAMQVRRKMIVDRKFQVGNTLRVLGLFFAMVSLIIAIIVVNIAISNARLKKVVRNHEEILTAQYETFNSLMVFSRTKSWDNLQKASDSVSTQINGNRKRIDSNIRTVRKLVRYNMISIVAIIFFVVLQGIILYFILIARTRRISGPLYYMTGQMENIIAGRKPDLRPLRGNDEFKEFYSVFRRMVTSLHEKDHHGHVKK